MINTIIINPLDRDREKIASMLTSTGDIKVLAQGKDGYDALKLIGSFKPDIAILCNHLEFIESGEIPPLLKTRSPLTAVVILAARISDHQLFRAVSNEVSGFVCAETDMDTLPWIIKCVSEGGCFISPWFAARVLHVISSTSRELQVKSPDLGIIGNSHQEDPAEYLSKMELQILTLIGVGKTSMETAKNLGLAVGTVRNYISSIMRKTGMRNRLEMARYALSYGLVPLNQG